MRLLESLVEEVNESTIFYNFLSLLGIYPELLNLFAGFEFSFLDECIEICYFVFEFVFLLGKSIVE